MNAQDDIRQDKELDRAVEALRASDVHAGPPAETLQALLAAGNAAGPMKTMKVRFTMKYISKIAAAILIVAGIAGLVAFLTIGHGGATIAWADVQECVRSAKTVTMSVVVDHGDAVGKGEMKTMILGPGRVRHVFFEPKQGRGVCIMDLKARKALWLLKDRKWARLDTLPAQTAEATEFQEIGDQDFLTRMKEWIEESQEELGPKEIDGRLASGYRIERGREVVDIWADAQTGVPIQVEMEVAKRVGQVHITMTDFEFGVELDEKLFILKVPEGYTLEGEAIATRPSAAEDLPKVEPAEEAVPAAE